MNQMNQGWTESKIKPEEKTKQETNYGIFEKKFVEIKMFFEFTSSIWGLITVAIKSFNNLTGLCQC